MIRGSTNRLTIVIAAALMATACSSGSSDGGAEKFTLYRNSLLDTSVRVHWATFDAAGSDRNYNRNNCETAARLLNANVEASAREEGQDRDPAVGFWCEPGGYSEKGTVPSIAAGAFPTDA
jgi:hypothetical protein